MRYTKHTAVVLFGALTLSVACASPSVQAQDLQGVTAYDHGPWNRLLSTYVTAENRFDYAALHGNAVDREALAGYVAGVAGADPSSLPDMERLAFWVNAYNALVVNAVLERYPLDNVLSVEGFFDTVTHAAGGEQLTLNGIENTKIREPFQQPLIHFALVCAARSCPPIRNEAYAGERIVEQMEEQARAFIDATTRVEGGQIHLSKIFEWYGVDWGGEAGVRAFVAERLTDDRAAAVRDDANTVVYDEYDWTLNAP